MSRLRVAYIIQLDLPGYPIKIGQTANPFARFDAFSASTPVDARWIGVTTNGVAREREMLDATKATIIKGEWRYVTPELRELVERYFIAGEWFEPVPDVKANIAEKRVAERAIALDPSCEGRSFRPRTVQYYWSRTAINLSADHDPTLLLHWCGFTEATALPSFVWPRKLRTAA